MKISQRVSEILSGQDIHTEISKGTNSVKNVGGVAIFVLCTLSDRVLYL